MSDSDGKPTGNQTNETTHFAHEDELRDQAEHETLGGVDLDHCGRMHE